MPKQQQFAPGLTSTRKLFFWSIYYEKYFCSRKYAQEALDSTVCFVDGKREPYAAALPGLRAPAGARAAKREVRGVARGRSSSHATIRSTLTAAAMATWCMWVFGKPRYRVRRNPNARTPCESVPSTPARCL